MGSCSKSDSDLLVLGCKPSDVLILLVWGSHCEGQVSLIHRSELLDVLAFFSFQWSVPLPTPVRMAVIPVPPLARLGAFPMEAARSAAPAFLVTQATGTSVLVSTCGLSASVTLDSHRGCNIHTLLEPFSKRSLPQLTQPWYCLKGKRKAVLWVRKQSQGCFPLD